MSLNTVNDIPKIVERLRSVCSRKGLRLVDITRKHVATVKWCKVVDNLIETTPVVVRWGEGFDTNILLKQDRSGLPLPCKVRALVKISYKEKSRLIHEASYLPETNLHIFLEEFFSDKKESTCVACMNDFDCVIPCGTCGNVVYCEDCMIKAVDQCKDQTKCPLCRCTKFFKGSFIGSFGGHPTLYKKYTDSHRDMKDPLANVLMQIYNPLFEKYN